MAKIEYEGKEYKSRSELARVLLMQNEKRKSEIAKITGIAPQTVHWQYQLMVEAGKMEDVYPELVARLDKEDEKKRADARAKKEEEKNIRKQARLALKAKVKEEALKTKADIVATACPFCIQMFEDAIAALEADTSIRALDLAEIVALSIG